jgi:hypothetical protein
VRALYEMGAFTVGGYVKRGSGDTRYNNFRLSACTPWARRNCI